ARRTRPDELLGLELARKAATLAAETGRQIGLLIGRDGQIENVVVGSKQRIYLPDLGRFRLDSARLRRIRLAVFIPDGDDNLERYPRGGFLPGSNARH